MAREEEEGARGEDARSHDDRDDSVGGRLIGSAHSHPPIQDFDR